MSPRSVCPCPELMCCFGGCNQLGGGAHEGQLCVGGLGQILVSWEEAEIVSISEENTYQKKKKKLLVWFGRQVRSRTNICTHLLLNYIFCHRHFSESAGLVLCARFFSANWHLFSSRVALEGNIGWNISSGCFWVCMCVCVFHKGLIDLHHDVLFQFEFLCFTVFKMFLKKPRWTCLQPFLSITAVWEALQIPRIPVNHVMSLTSYVF